VLLLGVSHVNEAADSYSIRSYGEVVKYGSGDVHFHSEIDSVQIGIGAVRDRYRLIQVLVSNVTRKPLRLSEENDKFEFQTGDKKIIGITQMYKQDPQFWDSLPKTSRARLAYPKQIAPGEEENIIVFVPTDSLGVPPDAIFVTLKSLGQSVRLRSHRSSDG
jgi:hypothetical protein